MARDADVAGELAVKSSAGRDSPQERLSKIAAILLVFFGAFGIFSQALIAAEPNSLDFIWKQLTIDVPSTPGSGFDVSARLLGRYIGKYLPGNPNVLIVNRPGAGGLTMTNYVYNSAPRDGTEIGTSAASFMIDRLLRGEKSESRFDPMQFNWIGNISQNRNVLLVSKASGLTLHDLLQGKKANMGATGTAANPWIFGRAINELAGTNINILPAYPGEAEVLLAIERGELDGIPAMPLEAIQALRPQWLTSGEMRILLQLVPSPMPEYPNVPNILQIITDVDNRAAMNSIILGAALGRPFFAPPGVPKERVEALRKAFDAAMSSPDLKAESAKSHVAIDPIVGVEVAEIIKRLNSPSEKVLKKLQSIFAD